MKAPVDLGTARLVARTASLAALVAILSSLIALQPSHAQNGSADSDQREGPATEGDGLIRNDQGAYQGYTLISPLQTNSTFLIDMEGRVVNRWDSEFRPASLGYLLENGHLLRAGEHPDPPYGRGPAAGGRIQEFNWEGELVWDFTYYTENALPHHDFVRLPNGNVILILRERITEEEAIAAGRIPDSVKDSELQPDSLIEIKPTGPTTGEIVWEWRLWDHLIQDYDPDKANFGNVAEHPELVDVNFDEGILKEMVNDADGRAQLRAIGYLGGGGRDSVRINPDWTHTNALAYNEEFDQLILSVHEFSEIWVIDHSTTTEEAKGRTGGRSGKGGDILYRWGNPIVYRAGTEEDRQLFAQHDAHWIPKGYPGEGAILVYNNQRPGDDGNYSTVDEIVPPVDSNGRYALGEDGKYGPEQAAWNYEAPNPTDFYSSFISGASRLPNGNTLICMGASGNLFEVTRDKQVVWQFLNPAFNSDRDGPGGPPGGGPPRGQGGPPGGPPGGGPPRGFGGPPGARPQIADVLPGPLRDMLELDDDQTKKVNDVQEEIFAKLAKLLSDEQDEQFERMRSGRGGFGGFPQPGQILSNFQQTRLNLDDAQKEQLAELQQSVEDKLGEILNDQQRERMSRGPGGRFGGGRPGGGRGGGGPNGRSIFRVYRYGQDYPGLAGKDLTPGEKLVDVAKTYRQDEDGEDD